MEESSVSWRRDAPRMGVFPSLSSFLCQYVLGSVGAWRTCADRVWAAESWGEQGMISIYILDNIYPFL
ncbi:hypothetical protein KDH_00310 [Dictyobacter sp. S3.2.2.5]|uniref:Uncharacterized protein n=1 Tax=Dictyobacter halimunensis TaxID=3026934 RepID=A0ABQ6FHX7_9CHLR|nr:hypothetical protein KDH_00010 [Dictyobacter sp. S3.2.2.5]GLV53176.1 hypothetical protein KDH_00310 [Dictyobacter sp. S3.2.2.5]